VKYAQAHGAHGYRVTSAKGMPALLKSIVAAPGVHLVEVPIDYSDNDRILNWEIRTLSAAI
jgi:acetolactate synthase I/II/III large subunit